MFALIDNRDCRWGRSEQLGNVLQAQSAYEALFASSSAAIVDIDARNFHDDDELIDGLPYITENNAVYWFGGVIIAVMILVATITGARERNAAQAQYLAYQKVRRGKGGMRERLVDEEDLDLSGEGGDDERSGEIVLFSERSLRDDAVVASDSGAVEIT